MVATAVTSSDALAEGNAITFEVDASVVLIRQPTHSPSCSYRFTPKVASYTDVDYFLVCCTVLRPSTRRCVLLICIVTEYALVSRGQLTTAHISFDPIANVQATALDCTYDTPVPSSSFLSLCTSPHVFSCPHLALAARP